MTERDGTDPLVHFRLTIQLAANDSEACARAPAWHEAVEGGTATVMACSGCLAAMHGVSDRERASATDRRASERERDAAADCCSPSSRLAHGSSDREADGQAAG